MGVQFAGNMVVCIYIYISVKMWENWGTVLKLDLQVLPPDCQQLFPSVIF